MRNEEDKYRKESGRQAARKENDSQYLNGERLEDDLIKAQDEDLEETQYDDEDLEENDEWSARENENRP